MRLSLLKKISILPVLSFLIGGCAVVKNYPKGKPFVYQTKLTIEGNISKDEKKDLKTGLENYWDDSLRARRLNELKLSLKHPLISKVLNHPPVFDSDNVKRTVRLMNSYLNSRGFYHSSFKDSIAPYRKVGDQQRVRIFLKIKTGEKILIDSVSYEMGDSLLDHLVFKNIQGRLIHKGDPYNSEAISQEIERLGRIFRDNGYYDINRTDLYAETDTTESRLLELTIDPLKIAEIARIAAENQKKTHNWKITFRRRIAKDSSQPQRYFVAGQYFYPETKLSQNPDSLIAHPEWFQSLSNHAITLRYRKGKFGIRPFLDQQAQQTDSLYNESLFYKTINSLGRIGAWQQEDARAMQKGKDSLDLYYFLVPSLKQNFTVDLEGSRNTGDITAGNLLGLSTNFSYGNRNLWKQAIQSVTTFRIGTELNVSQSTGTNYGLLQTFQVSLSQTYTIPRLILPHFNFMDKFNDKRTILDISASYTDRRTYYRLRNLTTSWRYSWNKDSIQWIFTPLNIELYKVDTLSGLITLFTDNPFLRNSFRNGNVIGFSLSLSRTVNSHRNPQVSRFYRFGFEQSGALLSLIPTLRSQIFNFSKLEAEYRYLYRFRKSELATRIFSGIVIPHGGQTVPTFKQYYLGGPNSMRAWGLRQLGLGSSILSDTSTSGYTDRFGNFAIEGNIEYRFNIWNFSSFKIGSAVFTDIGNLWNIKKDASNPNSEFSISRLYKDIAIGVGTGIRFDFNYFLIRLDLGYKVKDPARQSNNGWVDLPHFVWKDHRINGVKISNLSWQLGIGLPF